MAANALTTVSTLAAVVIPSVVLEYALKEATVVRIHGTARTAC